MRRFVAAFALKLVALEVISVLVLSAPPAVAQSFVQYRQVAVSSLATTHAPGATTLQLQPGTGQFFGTPTVDDPIRVVVSRRTTLQNGFLVPTSTRTVYLATGRSGDTLTGVAVASDENEANADSTYVKNDPVQMMLTGGMLKEIDAAIAAGGGAADATVVHKTGDETIAGIKTFNDSVMRSVDDTSVGMVLTKEAGSNSISCLDIYNKTNYVDHLFRVFIPQGAVNLPGEGWFPRIYINGGGHIYTQGAFTISGTFTGSGDNTVIVPPSLALGCLQIWSDVYSPCIVTRPPMGGTPPQNGSHMVCIDNAGLYRFGIQVDGSLWWGQQAVVDVTDANYGWPDQFDTTLNRVGVAALGTDGDFYAGVASGAPRDNKLIVRAGTGSSSHMELWSEGAAALQLFATSSVEGHMQVGTRTVLRYYNNPVGVAGASVAIGGVDDATAALVVDNTANNNTVKGLVVRKHATQSGSAIELQTSAGSPEWKVDNNGRWTIIGQENPQSGVLRVQARGDTGNDDAGISLYAPTTPNSPASRNWQMVGNFNQGGNLDIMRSTTSTGSPQTVVMSFDASGHAGVGTAVPGGQFQVNADNSGTIGSIVKLAAGHSVDAVLVEDSSFNPLWRVLPDGGMSIGGDIVIGDAGLSPDPNSDIWLSGDNWTITSGTRNGIWVNERLAPTASSTAQVMGINSVMSVSPQAGVTLGGGTWVARAVAGVTQVDNLSAGGTVSGRISGLYGEVFHNGSASVGTEAAVTGSVWGVGGAGTVTKAVRFLALAGSAGGATYTNNYGFYCESMTTGTNNYAFYSEGGQSVLNAGTASTVPLALVAAASQTANLQEWRNSGGVAVASVKPNGAITPASLADSAAANGTFYFSTDAGKMVYKDGSGVVNALY